MTTPYQERPVPQEIEVASSRDQAFIGRLDVFTRMREVIQALRRGEVCDSVRGYLGVKGVGKTALLQELERRYKYKPVANRDEATLVIPVNTEKGNDMTVYDVSQQITGSLELQLVDLSSTEELLSNLHRALMEENILDFGRILGHFCQNHNITPIMLFDNFDELNPEVCRDIGHGVMQPLVTIGNGAGVITGQEVPRIGSFEVNRRLASEHIRPLNTDELKKIWEAGNTKIPYDAIAQYEVGSPWVIQRLVDKISDGVKLEEDALTLLIGEVLTEYQVELLKGINPELVEALTLLSPLRSFRVHDLQAMLGLTHYDPRSWNLSDTLGRTSGVAYWSRAHRAFVIEPVLRNTLNTVNRLRTRDNYVAIHNQAARLYKQWALQYADVSDRFIPTILYHAGEAYRTHKDIGELQTEVDDALSTLSLLTPERLSGLLDTLEHHPDIKSLIPSEIVEQILHNVRSTVQN